MWSPVYIVEQILIFVVGDAHRASHTFRLRCGVKINCRGVTLRVHEYMKM